MTVPVPCFPGGRAAHMPSFLPVVKKSIHTGADAGKAPLWREQSPTLARAKSDIGTSKVRHWREQSPTLARAKSDIGNAYQTTVDYQQVKQIQTS